MTFQSEYNYRMPTQITGLLGFDPAEMRRQAIFRGMFDAGAAMMAQQPTPYPQGLAPVGEGLLAFGRGMENAQRDYYDQWRMGLDAHEAQAQIAEREREAAERERQQAAINEWIPTLPPEVQAFFRAFPDEAVKVYGEQMFPKPFEPNIETIVEGLNTQSGYMGPDGKWVTLGEGPRFAPQQPQPTWTRIDDPTQYGFPAGSVVTQNSLTGDYQTEYSPDSGGGGVTPAQLANNREIERSRQFIESLNLSSAELAMAAKPTNEFGMPNPQYNPLIGRALSASMQRMVGDDPQYETFTAKYFGLDASATPVGDQGGDTGVAIPLPMSSGGTVDSMSLKQGQVYQTPEGLLRWNGRDFEVLP